MGAPKKSSRRGPSRKNYMKQQDGVEIDTSIVNNKPVNKNVEDITEKNYERQLQNWDDFVQEHGPRSVDSLGDLKEYVFRIGMAMKAGKQPGEKLAWKGINSYWKKFTAGYNRERGTIPKDHLTSVTRLIEPRGALGKLLNVVADTGPRRHATAEVLTWTGEYFWTLDWKIFARPRLRNDMWAALLMAAFTAARVSDYIESSSRYNSNIGLHYKDTQLIVYQNERGEAEFALQSTKFLKGRCHAPSTLPTPDIHERGNLEPQPLYTNPILFLLAIFCSAGALKDYEGLDGLLRLLELRPEAKEIIHIQWGRSVLTSPIFSGAKGRIMTARLFSKELRALLMRAGFPEPPSLHCFRAEGLTNIDMNSNYSDIQRQTMAGHVNNQIQARHYSSRNPGIDSQAAFMRSQARLMNVGELFRNLEISWVPELWHSLPIAKKEELAMTDDYKEIEAQIEAFPTTKLEPFVDLPTGPEFKPEAITLTPTELGDTSLAHPVRKLRRDLESLEKKTLNTLWKETSRGTVVGDKRTDHLHIYQCKKKQFSYAEFCFFCNQWLYDPGAWEKHCHEHLKQDLMPMELSWERVEMTFLPGNCPFCLWNTGLGCAERLQSFCCLSDWEAHIRAHSVSWQERCPDPRCEESFHDGDSYQNHLHDLHRVPKKLLLPAQASLKRGDDDVSQEELPTKKVKLGDGPVEASFVFHYYDPGETLSGKGGSA
ncbi:Zinc finger protein [Verticillium dahliae VDG2]|nr:Zinc finger protein [Verticillium dahliae VDG2]